MKISYKWLKDFISLDLTAEEISSTLTSVGLEVESIEKVQRIPGGLEGLVIGFVKERSQHPNADRLSITRVDVGNGTDLQIVCGAPNVAAGQKVIVAQVGTTVYPVSGEPFKINKSKIRGEVSEGMICAEDEIGLGGSHAGIMILPEDAPLGQEARVYFNLEDDIVFEIGLTPNRADAASHLGVARDLAAYYRKQASLPEASVTSDVKGSLVQVEVRDTEACPRYSSVVIKGVTIQDSPEWLQTRLISIGLKPINNVVDITNYVCHALGQPMHAFDAAGIKGNKVVVRKAVQDERFTTLDEVERKLSAEDLVICDENEVMCIAGVFGGIRSGVKASTQTVFLESAYFNPVSVRKTAKRHALKTDASFRFERGTDPEITMKALEYATRLILEIAGGEIASEFMDHYPVRVEKAKIEVSYARIQSLIGKEIPAAEIRDIIKALDFSILKETAEGLSIEVPTVKVDVTRECDIVEDVLRIYGLNNIEMPSQVRSSLSFPNKPDKEKIQDQVSNLLSAQGFNEIMSNSLSRSAYADWLNPEEKVSILNPLSNELDVLRPTMLFSGLEAVSFNQKRQSADLKLFEFGSTYRKVNGQYKETQYLSLFIAGTKNAENWNSSSAKADFYYLRSFVDGMMKKMGISDYQLHTIADQVFAEGLSYMIGEKTYVSFGKVAKAPLKMTDVSGDVYYAEFNWDHVMQKRKKYLLEYREIARFPSVRRDLSMLLDKQVSFEELKKIALQTEKYLLKEVQVFDVYEGDKIPQGKKSYALSFILQDEEKTLNDKQIDSVMDKLIRNYEEKAGAEIRKA